MANWSEIQDDIGYEIAKHVPLDVEEFARLGCVSKLWRSFTMYHKYRCTPCAPWLMLTKKENDKKDGDGVYSFYSVSNHRFFNMNLPQVQGKRCWGTPYGWLITMGLDLNINVLNPLSCVQIPLPPQPTLPEQYDFYVPSKKLCGSFITKIILPSNPSFWSTNTHQCPLVFAIYGEFCYLAFAHPGDKAWVGLEGPDSCDATDAIFFNGQIFVVTHKGMLRICEIDSTPPTATDFAPPPENFKRGNNVYLVEMSGNLYLLIRNHVGIDEDEYDYGSEAQPQAEDVDDHGADDTGEAEGEAEDETVDVGHDQVECVSENKDASFGENEGEDEDEDEDVDDIGFRYETKHFFVNKFDFSAKKWTTVNDLGDHAFIAGNSQSFSISISDYPGFRSNCVYFTDDHSELYEYSFCDMGIYDLGKDTVEDICASSDVNSMRSRPVFFMPSFS